MSKIRKQILGFLFAGSSANLVSFLFYSLSFKVFNQSVFISSITGQSLGLLTNYLINSRVVFKKNLKVKKKFIFLSYYLTTIFLVGKFTNFLTNISIEYRLSWLIAVAIAAMCNFLFVKFIAFND
tara:strand:+ start:282 stop:656 length:375 start_codon:yes stop_codon:yes gene_type:complete